MQASYNDKRNIFNKSHLIETIVRNRIKDTIFYKQYLYLTNEQTILPVIVNHVKYISGLDANNRPGPFLCCLLRLLEISPSSIIIQIYLNQTNFKYLTALILLYIRMTYKSHEVYSITDPYFSNFSRLKVQLSSPKFHNGIAVNYDFTFMDVFVDELLHNDRVVDILLPRMESRLDLMDKGVLGQRQYFITSLEEETDDISPIEKQENSHQEEEEEDDDDEEKDDDFQSDSD